MAWIESNKELLRSINEKTGRAADRAAASKEASKNRLFGAASNLVSGIHARREADKARTHEEDMEKLRQGGRMKLQENRQEWSSEEREAAEKAVEGFPEWDNGDYGGSWTDHNGKTWYWNSIQEQRKVKQDIMNAAAEAEAERAREHESTMEDKRQKGRMELQESRQEWSTLERKAAEKAIEGMPEWDPDLYVGSWTDHNGKKWSWGNKQEYDLIKQDIMNEAAERAAAARNEREPTSWWPVYEKVSNNMLANRTDIWDAETNEFAGWNNAGGKEAIIKQFTQGITGQNLTPEQEEAAIAYFSSFLDDIESGSMDLETVEEALQSPVLKSNAFSGQPQEGHLETITPVSGGGPRAEPVYEGEGGGTRLGPEGEGVSPTVESFWDKLTNLSTVQPKQTAFQKAKTALSGGGGMSEEIGGLWDSVQSIIPTLTREDVSTLSDKEEMKMRQLILSGVNDQKLSKGELETFMELVGKINENKAARSDVYNTP